jgi:tetratricopeptide (TPR) repeat protein
MSGPYNMHALLLLGRGELDESARWYRRSLGLDELDSPGARIGLAAILQKQGKLQEAVDVLEPLPDSHYEAASKQEWLGNLALLMREPRAAVAAYSKAIELDSSKRNAYQGLFIAHRMLGDTAAARAIDARLRSLPAPK